MPAEKPEPKYNCSQAELYAACDIGWDSFAENLADFANHKTFYDAAFLAARRGEVKAALELPDVQARGEKAEVFAIKLRVAARSARMKWNALRSYIREGFGKELVKPQLEAAGHLRYAAAERGDWEELKALLVAGKNFIAKNSAVLGTPGGMPAGFPATYNAAMGAFDTLYLQLKDAEQDSGEGTAVKINANNLIYEKLTRMFEDGQLIYAGNAAKRARFVFRKVKGLVSSGKNI